MNFCAFLKSSDRNLSGISTLGQPRLGVLRYPVLREKSTVQTHTVLGYGDSPLAMYYILKMFF